MATKPIDTYELIEALKDCSSNSFESLKKYSKEQLHETENLLHEAVKYAPLSAIKYLVEEMDVPLFHMTPPRNIVNVGHSEDELAIIQIKNRSTRFKDSGELYTYLMDNMSKKNSNWASLDTPTSSTLDAIVDDNNLNNNQKKDLIIKALEVGADINKNHDIGYPSTVLGRALLHKNSDLAKFLIDAGANPDLPEPAIKNVSSPTSLGFDSTGEIRGYVYHIKNPTPTDSQLAMKGLLKDVEANNIQEIQRHLELPEFRRLTVGGKNLYEMAKETIGNISNEMQDLLKYNVAPKIEKLKETLSTELSTDKLFSFRDKFLNSPSQENKTRNML